MKTVKTVLTSGEQVESVGVDGEAGHRFQVSHHRVHHFTCKQRRRHIVTGAQPGVAQTVVMILFSTRYICIIYCIIMKIIVKQKIITGESEDSSILANN